MVSPEFELGTGFLLSRIGSRSARQWYGMLAEFQLTPHQHAVLLLLRQGQPLGQQQLAALMGVDQRNLLPILEGLEEREIIRRDVDAVDRRRRILTLTAQGNRLAGQLFDSGQEIEKKFLAGISESERSDLNRILLALDRSLDV